MDSSNHSKVNAQSMSQSSYQMENDPVKRYQIVNEQEKII